MNTRLQGTVEHSFSIKKAILAIILGVISLTLAQGISSLVYKLPFPNPVLQILFGVLYVAIAYIFIRLCCTEILHISMKECFIGRPKIKTIWLVIAVLLPVIVTTILLCLPGELVKSSINATQATNIIACGIFNAGLGAGIVEEMVFRGMIMKALDKCFGKVTAIILPSFIFALMHLIGMKMNIISILLLIVAGTSAGIMFSLIAYESESIWCSAAVHGIWNVIMIGGILNISNHYSNRAIYSYELASKSIILTGGEFGIETSIVSVLGFIIVIVFTLSLIRRRTQNI